MVSLNRIVFIFVMVCMPFLVTSSPQEARVNQKKIKRDHAKKQKKAMKDYNDAVKRHNKNQSKSTRTSMKKTKKESKSRTPSMH
jgi:hypothetical protein